MRDYELVAIVNPELDEDGVSQIIDRLTQSISGQGGEVDEVKKWGRRKLAYPIDSFMEAEYFHARFKLAPKPVKELEAQMTASGDILRHLVVKLSD